jgi:hypothetical protein
VQQAKLNLLQRIRGLSIEKRSLLLAEVLLAVLASYRFYSYWTTGFYVSDEYGYFFDAIHGAIYGDRWFFGWMNIVLFKALGIASVDAFSYLLPFYIFFWAGVTLIVFYKLLKLLSFDVVTTTLSLISCLILISFLLLSLGFLTEPVGLCMAMLGIYFLARYMKSRSVAGGIGFPLLSACFFGFAAGTREPYNAFLIGGILIILVLAFAKRKEVLGTRNFGAKAFVAVSFIAFVLPSLFFLYVPTHAYTQQIVPISSQLAQSIISNPLTSGGSASTTTITTTITNTITFGNRTTTTTTVVTTVAAGPGYPFYKQFVLTNMLLIFFGGILLGWGPICFAIGLAGFLLLLQRSVRQREVTYSFLFLTSLTALGSYLVVSFIYAPDPAYFSFQNYSTLIRFSDTALPAYFLTVALVMSFVAKSQKRIVAILAIFATFLIVAVPVYQVYAASNFNYTSGQNPFQFGYRTDAVLLRDYLDSNAPNNQNINLVGVPYGWTFTPGVQDLYWVHAYAIGDNPLVPGLSLSNFTSMRWSTLYLYISKSQSFPPEQTFLTQLLNSTAVSKQTITSPFKVVESHVVLQGTDSTLYEVQLRWS